MSVRRNELQDAVDALNAYSEKLNVFFYSHFHFCQLPSNKKTSNSNTYLKTRPGNRLTFESMLIEMRSVLALSLELYISYRDSWFSDKQFASDAKAQIDKLSAEYDKMNYFFRNYSILEE